VAVAPQKQPTVKEITDQIPNLAARLRLLVAGPEAAIPGRFPKVREIQGALVVERLAGTASRLGVLEQRVRAMQAAKGMMRLLLQAAVAAEPHRLALMVALLPQETAAKAVTARLPQ
jgi:hypothetical protein